MKYAGLVGCFAAVLVIGSIICAANPLRNYSVLSDKILGWLSIVCIVMAGILAPLAVFLTQNDM